MLFVFTSEGQSPSGKLIIHSTPSAFQDQGRLGYIEYPAGQYHYIDSLSLTDMAHDEGYLFVAGNSLIRYDLATNTMSDSLDGVGAYQIAIWQDQLYVSHYQQPYLRIYDKQSLSLTGSVDTHLISQPAGDLLIYGNELMMLFADRIQAIDLIQQDTSTAIKYLLGPGFSMAGTHIVEHEDYFIIDIDFFTAVPSYGVSAIHKTSGALDSLFFGIYLAQLTKPVVAQDQIYVMNYPSRYDLTLDSLFLSANDSGITFGLPSSRALAYDPFSSSLFIQNVDSSTVSFVQSGAMTGRVSVPNLITNACFVSDSTVDTVVIDAIEPHFGWNQHSFFPNPVKSGELFCFMAETKGPIVVELFDLTGRLRTSISVRPDNGLLRFKIGTIDPGLYLIRYRYNSTEVVQKIEIY